MADTPRSERRTSEERWATFSGAFLGIAVLTAALTGSVRTVFLWVVGVLTVSCIYGFARTFAPLRAVEITLLGFYRDWKKSRHPYWSAYQRFEGTAVTPAENVVWLHRASFIPEETTQYPKASDLKLRCEMNRLFRQGRVLCTDRRNLLNWLALMLVPRQFLETEGDATVLRKGRYMLRWYDEDTDALIMTKRVKSWGHDPRDGWWRKFRGRLSSEFKKLKGQEMPVPSSEDE